MHMEMGFEIRATNEMIWRKVHGVYACAREQTWMKREESLSENGMGIFILLLST
jgi:hypothetical protein